MVIRMGNVQCQILPFLKSEKKFIHFRIFKMLEDGLIHKWKLMYWPDIQGCEKEQKAESLTLKDIQGILFTYTALIMMAFIVLVVEILLHKYLCGNAQTDETPRANLSRRKRWKNLAQAALGSLIPSLTKGYLGTRSRLYLEHDIRCTGPFD